MIYKCAEHPTNGVIKCKQCDWGAYEVKSGRNGLFFGCHLWSSSGCRGTKNIDENVGLQPLPKLVESKITSRAGKKWTLEEDINVVELVIDGKTLEEIALIKSRKASAIKARLLIWLEASDSRLRNIPNKKSVDYSKHDEAWNAEESNRLNALWQGDSNIIDITEIMQRPKHQIISELFDIGLIDIDSRHKEIVISYHSSKLF